ncbi:MAG: YunC family protein [Methanoregulaceae archaeon]|nr:YunC family protein [Methanoregulaceae archaeon]
MIQQDVRLARGMATGYVIQAGPISIVAVIGGKGMVGCGAFDVVALGNHGYPAVRVRSCDGKPISSIAELLSAEVRDANEPARALGVVGGMSGREALDLLN